MTANEALRMAVGRLRAGGIEDAALDARLLMAHALGIAQDRLTYWKSVGAQASPTVERLIRQAAKATV